MVADMEDCSAKRLKFEVTEAVNVLVGPNERKFVLSEELVKAAPFFSKALNPNFVEGQTRTVRLPQFEPEVFDAMVYSFLEKRLDEKELEKLSAEDRWMWLAKLYQVADYTCAIGVQNLVTRKALLMIKQSIQDIKDKKTFYIPSPKVVDYVYENSCEGCALRQLLVAQRIWGMGGIYNDRNNDIPTAMKQAQDMATYNIEFLGEVATTAIRRVNSCSKANEIERVSANKILDRQDGRIITFIGLQSRDRHTTSDA